MVQAALRLRARVLTRFYLAVHPAGSLPGGYAVPMVVRCCSVHEEAPGVRQNAGQLSPSPVHSLGEQAKIVNDADMCSVLFVLIVNLAVWQSCHDPLLTPGGVPIAVSTSRQR